MNSLYNIAATASTAFIAANGIESITLFLFFFSIIFTKNIEKMEKSSGLFFLFIEWKKYRVYKIQKVPVFLSIIFFYRRAVGP